MSIWEVTYGNLRIYDLEYRGGHTNGNANANQKHLECDLPLGMRIIAK